MRSVKVYYQLHLWLEILGSPRTEVLISIYIKYYDARDLHFGSRSDNGVMSIHAAVLYCLAQCVYSRKIHHQFSLAATVWKDTKCKHLIFLQTPP